MAKVIVTKKLFDALEMITTYEGKDRLYQIEWLMSHYKGKCDSYTSIGDHIDVIVEFIKQSNQSRQYYFKALVNGYERLTPEDCVKDYYDSIALNIVSEESENSSWANMKCRTIRDTLDLLEVKIEGVNA